jgi:hypothetical protein
VIPFHLTENRNTDLLGFATDLYDSVVIQMIREGRPIPSTPFLQSRDFQPLKNIIAQCLFAADRRIYAHAAFWGLKFMSVSDLNGKNVGYLKI